MKKTVLILLSALALALPATHAQNAFRAAYFMDTYLYAHTMNPALCANRGYASLGLGRIDIQTQSNLGASTFLYPTTGGSVNTFLSEGVSSEDFLRKIRRDNLENANLQLDLLNFGFWTRKQQFHSFSLNIRVSEAAAVPYDLFRFLKEGSTNGTTYDLSGTGTRARAYAEASYGISFPVTEALRIGGRAKLLVGLAYADARMNRFDVTLSGERWRVSTDGTLRASNMPVTQQGGPVALTEIFDLDELSWDSLRPSGFGAALDLGATWDVLPWLQLSASVTDLGLIRWEMDARMGTAGAWEYTGFERISFEGDNDFESQLNAKMQQLNDLLKFRNTGEGSPTDFLPATFYLGAKAHPASWFSVGVLGTTRREGHFSWSEVRGALNLEPAHWFGWSASAAYGTFGPKWGTALNLRIPGIALFAGAEMSSPYFVSSDPRASHSLMDYINGDVVAFPRDNLNLDFIFGLNIVFGKKHLGPRQ